MQPRPGPGPGYLDSTRRLSTLAVMRRETGSWRWPALGFAYMLALAWVGSFVTYRLALALA